MKLIATATVGAGGAATINFSSIPSIYTDLTLILCARGTDATAYIAVRFNNSVTSDYYRRAALGTGSSASPSAANADTQWTLGMLQSRSDNTANTFGNSEIYIPNYAGNLTKTGLGVGMSENNAAAAFQLLSAGYRDNTASINQITLTPSAGSFAQYSTASIYGITKGTGGATAA